MFRFFHVKKKNRFDILEVTKTYLRLCTLFPPMKLDLPVPLIGNISRGMATFPTPWSTLTLKK